MAGRRTFSTMEMILLGVLIGSLVLAFLQARRQAEPR